MKKLNLTAGLSSLALTLYATSAKASEATCTVNGQPVDCGELADKAAGFLGWGLLIFALFVAFSIWATVFWILMLVHVAKHDVENKAMWIVLMVFTGILGSIIYYFVEKRQMQKTQPMVPPQQ